MKKTLPAVLLLMLALSPAYAIVSTSFSTGSANLAENMEVAGHFGNYTLVAFASTGNVYVAVFGTDESRKALVSEIGWLMQNGKFNTTCNVSAMPEGQGAGCNAEAIWESANPAVPAPAPMRTATEDNGIANQLVGAAGAQKTSSFAPPLPSAHQQEGDWGQVLQMLGAFLAVLIASYLILHGRQAPAPDAAAEKLLDNPTRAGIMGELSEADRIPTDISNKLGKSKASVVEHLSALMEAGLVERIATPGKKFVFYKLTQKGRQVLLRRAG
jgi:DNA-binding transcriptional ArsR family regulator